MPDLSFEILSATPARDMLTPAISFDLRVTNRFPEQPIHAVLLRCQLQIDVARRRYSATEQSQLHDLFDNPGRWNDTLRAMTWANLSVNVPAFRTATSYSLVLPCNLDWDAAFAKYFHGLDGGDVPLSFLFSGSVLYDGGQGALQIEPISWNKEARFRMPAEVWKRLMELHYPNSVALNLRRDLFDELYRLKTRLGLSTFEQAIEHMLRAAEREQPIS